MKQIKDGKKSHIGSDSLRKSAFFMSAIMKEARIVSKHVERFDEGPMQCLVMLTLILICN